MTIKEIERGEWRVVAHIGREEVGRLTFIESQYKPVLKATQVTVEPNHRRKGIGSDMYVFAERELGKRFVRTEDVLTPDGKAIWNSPNRKFGI